MSSCALTSHFALPFLIKNQSGLVVEMTDGTAEYYHANYRLSLFYDFGHSHGLGATHKFVTATLAGL